jgi:hypothetical protein
MNDIEARLLFEMGLDREGIIYLIEGYDNYIWNDGELWDADRQPVSFLEWLDNEYAD